MHSSRTRKRRAPARVEGGTNLNGRSAPRLRSLAPLRIAIGPERQEQQRGHNERGDEDAQHRVVAMVVIEGEAEIGGAGADADDEEGEDQPIEQAEGAASEITADEEAEQIDLGADRQADEHG